MENRIPHRYKLRQFWWLLLLGCLLSIVIAGCERESYFEGRVEMRELNIATKYPGRLSKLYMIEGQMVKKGSLLAEISDPEADARMVQANAGVTGASAQQEKIKQGARPEEVSAAHANMEASRAQYELAKVTEIRMRSLFEQGVVPRQRLDEATAARRSTYSIFDAARAEYELVSTGARSQDKTTADAVTKAAEGERQLVEAALIESRVYALADGQITEINFHEGEIIAAGIPIAILARVDIPWVSFNVREDMLRGLEVGQILTARVPALADSAKKISLRVDRIAVLGDYGTWQSTRALGSYDLRTFEVRARPVKAVEGLRAGMSVLVPHSEVGRIDE